MLHLPLWHIWRSALWVLWGTGQAAYLWQPKKPNMVRWADKEA